MATGVIYAFDPYATYHWMPLTWLVAVSICLLHTVVLGAPSLWLLHRMAKLNLWSALTIGLLVGLLPTLGLQLIGFFTSIRGSEPTLFQTLVAPTLASILGTIGAWSFMYASGISSKRHDA
jgi:hypothetical protein